MLEYSLPTKPAEPLEKSRVLGLQLCDAGSEVTWRRRFGRNLCVPEVLTKRAILKWSGRLTGHLPVCSWLRPACSYIKRLAVTEADCDEPVSDQVAEFCRQLDPRVTGDGDPARGRWQVPSDKDVEYVILCDASDIGLGVVVEVDRHDIEDRSWLRPAADTQFINVSELEATIKGLYIAVRWGATKVRLMTDSKSPASWLNDVVRNSYRVCTKGLHEVVVQRRLQIVSDIVIVAGLSVIVVWVPSAKNRADILTRVPATWTAHGNSTVEGEQHCSKPHRWACCGPVQQHGIAAAQRTDALITEVISQIEGGRPLHELFT